MSDGDDTKDDVRSGRRIHAQLLNLHERILTRLRAARADLEAPTTHRLVRQVRSRTGSPVTDLVGQVTQAVEDALRAVQVCQSELQKEIVEEREEAAVDDAPNLPPVLRRFLAERAEAPGFRYDVVQDPVRGWIVRWKEYTDEGTVRGHGRFYERPYAWIDE